MMSLSPQKNFMYRIAVLPFLLLISNHCQSQKTEIGIDTVKSFVYLITIGTKQFYQDSTYAYSGGDKLQIASIKKLSLNAIKAKIKKRLEYSKPNDTAFIDCNFLYLDDLMRNDNAVYQLLKPVKERCSIFKHSSNSIRNHYSKLNKKEISYTIECVEAEWIEINSNRDILEMILGRTILMFNNGASNCCLFILKSQIDSYYL